jgi:hypothetical protein
MRGHKRDELQRQNNIKQLVALLTVAFVVSLGVVVGTRMSSDAIAVLAGVLAGVAASIPTALLLMVVTRRRDQEVEPYDEPARSSPPVIVVAPGGISQPQLPYPMAYPYQGPAPARGRQFRVMGLDEEEEAVDGEVDVMPWYG